MAVALEQFVKSLEDSGVIARGNLENFLPPNASPKDAQELARELVKSKHLTKYQVQEIYLGRARALILGNYTILDRIGAGGMGQVLRQSIGGCIASSHSKCFRRTWSVMPQHWRALNEK